MSSRSIEDILSEIGDKYGHLYVKRTTPAWQEREFKPYVNECGWWIGPIAKLDGETCICTKPEGHEMPHYCSCGAWFEGCGHPPEETV